MVGANPPRGTTVSQPQPAAIVLDFTGTLATLDPPPGPVYAAIARQFGIDADDQTTAAKLRHAVRNQFGGPWIEKPTDEDVERARWRRIVVDSLPAISEELTDRLYDRLWHHFADPAAWRVRPDAAETLGRLRARGILTAVGSNFDCRLDGLVGPLGLAEHLSAVLPSSRVGWNKPNVRFFHEVARRLGLRSGPGLWMVGDTWVNDVTAARAAGWSARWVAWEDRLWP